MQCANAKFICYMEVVSRHNTSSNIQFSFPLFFCHVSSLVGIHQFVGGPEHHRPSACVAQASIGRFTAGRVTPYTACSSSYKVRAVVSSTGPGTAVVPELVVQCCAVRPHIVTFFFYIIQSDPSASATAVFTKRQTV